MDQKKEKGKGETSSIASNEVEKNVVDRGEWGSQVEFVLTCIGFAVGLGNVWRFPYLVYANGGGAFLIPYIIMIIFVGVPIFFLETCFGQFAGVGPLSVFTISPVFKGVGLAMQIVSVMIMIYYNIIVAWCMYYFFASMWHTVPWASCGNWWNTPECIAAGQNSSTFPPNVTTITSSEEYFYKQVLRMSGSIDEPGAIQWQLTLCLLLAWIIIFLVLLNGVSSLGKASYFVSLFPYVLLTIMLVRGVTLPGASMGIDFYIRPDWARLADMSIWGDAATQVFYSMGLCQGGLIAMSSFNKFKNNLIRDTCIIPAADALTSIYAGFVIFSVLGYMAETKGVPVSEVATSGPGLVFVVYPEGLATMPLAPLWSVLFFFMLATLGFSSQFSTAEAFLTAYMDEYPGFFRRGYRPMAFRATFCIVCFLLGLPMVTQGGFYMFMLVDEYAAGYPVLIIGFLEIIVLTYVYGYKDFAQDIIMMLGVKPSYYWMITWYFVAPALLIFVFIFKVINQVPLYFGDCMSATQVTCYWFPDWANVIAWLIVATPLVAIVVVFLYKFCIMGGYEILVHSSSPTTDWGPVDPENRTGRYRKRDLELEITEAQEKLEVQAKSLYIAQTGLRQRPPSSQPPDYNGRANHAYEYEMSPTTTLPGSAATADQLSGSKKNPQNVYTIEMPSNQEQTIEVSSPL